MFNKIFNLLYKQLLFIPVFSPNDWFHSVVRTTIIIQGDYKQDTTISSPKHVQTRVVLFSWDCGQVDVALHRRQWFNLASCPASLPLPQAARRAIAKPTVATSFANDPFVVVNVGHSSHRHHAGLMHLCMCRGNTLSSEHNRVLTRQVECESR